ncbi:MAG: DUF5013 domain-containing protein [Prevotellaceae bacterium]|jgi:hypothetical protein|nr:DUF5013 domain-containing protein [Prevotellaceae bacterium]
MKAKHLCAVIFAAISMAACDKMLDNVKPYLDEGETIYVGKAYYTVLPGKNRAEISGNMPYGITQTNCLIEWIKPSGEADSLRLPLDRAASDTISVVLTEMEEGPYDFTITTFDAKGNKSIPVEAHGYVYGEIYESALINRKINRISFDGANVKVQLVPTSDPQAVESELSYEMPDGSFTSIAIPIDLSEIDITGCKSQGIVSWRTSYLPDSTAIDLFYSKYDTLTAPKIVSKINLTDPGPGFEMDGDPYVNGRFGKAKYWTTNAAADGNGTVDGNSDNCLDLWAWSGYSPGPLVNGKIYQTLILEQGEYRFDVEMQKDNSIDQAYLVAASGNTLPNVENLSAALASLKTTGANGGEILSITFTVDSAGEISFGMLATVPGSGEFAVRKVELWKID